MHSSHLVVTGVPSRPAFVPELSHSSGWISILKPVKQEREFFDPADVAWAAALGVRGVTEKVLSTGDGPVLTRLARWEPGLDTVEAGVIRHDYIEEVYLLEGDLTDLTLNRTFHAGEYACRPVGMAHGPYRTEAGCTMLEIRY